MGKTDALDAHQIAAATLPLPVEKLRRPRLNDGIRQAVRILTTARGAMNADRTRSVNALNALVQEELRDPVPGPHEIRADVLAGTHQITRRFIRVARDPHGCYLSQQGQPGQMLGIAGISLDPVARGPLQLGRCGDQALDTGGSQSLANPNPVGPAS